MRPCRPVRARPVRARPVRDRPVRDRRNTGLRGRRDQCGAAAVEITLLIPAVLLLIGLIVASGRVWFARTAVADAAQAAARAASLARTTGQAGTDARDVADRSLRTSGLSCTNTTVSVDTGAFGLAVGTPGTIRARITCRAPFSDLTVPGMPGSMVLTGDGAAALDTYRARR